MKFTKLYQVIWHRQQKVWVHLGPHLPLPNGIKKTRKKPPYPTSRNHEKSIGICRFHTSLTVKTNFPLSHPFPFLRSLLLIPKKKGEHVKTTPRLMRLFGTSLSANRTPPRWCPNPTGAKNGNGHRHMAAFMKATASRVKIGIKDTPSLWSNHLSNCYGCLVVIS